MNLLHYTYQWLRGHFRPYWPPVGELTDEGINRYIGELLEEFPSAGPIAEADAMEMILGAGDGLSPENRAKARRRRAEFPDFETMLAEAEW